MELKEGWEQKRSAAEEDIDRRPTREKKRVWDNPWEGDYLGLTIVWSGEVSALASFYSLVFRALCLLVGRVWEDAGRRVDLWAREGGRGGKTITALASKPGRSTIEANKKRGEKLVASSSAATTTTSPTSTYQLTTRRAARVNCREPQAQAQLPDHEWQFAQASGSQVYPTCGPQALPSIASSLAYLICRLHTRITWLPRSGLGGNVVRGCRRGWCWGDGCVGSSRKTGGGCVVKRQAPIEHEGTKVGDQHTRAK